MLVRAMDDELSATDRAAFDLHLSECDACRGRYHELGVLSVQLEAALNRSADEYNEREQRYVLEQELIRREQMPILTPRSGKVARRVGWSMAIAASLAVSVLFIPHHPSATTSSSAFDLRTAQPSTFEVDGESFFPLPYSNSELPLGTPHIVQMQVPVSSLTDAGLAIEPVSSQAGDPDSAVLADVLLGADGEPLGVHVIDTQ
ncbi:MAG: zf-HC2 domain-containing protein [Acidobacteriaceae bacterium]|nr:zf-HC2 domain-containing protein [Acidobacteriaceae bacterium]